MSRTFESNGPDVKIRGTAAHVADKYVQLARDAQASGDPVAAENYFQHAEHYYRILAAAQPPFQGQPSFVRADQDDLDDVDDDEDGQAASYEAGPQGPGQGQPSADMPQPYFQGGEGQERRDRSNDRNRYQGRDGRDRERERQGYEQRQPGRDRFGEDERSGGERSYRDDRPPQRDRMQGRDRTPRDPDRQERPPRAEPAEEAASADLPAFITGSQPAVLPAQVNGHDAEEGEGPREEGVRVGRGRRRRYGRFGRGGEGGEAGPAGEVGAPDAVQSES